MGEAGNLSVTNQQEDRQLRLGNDIILLMDEEGRLLDANEVAEKTYGWPLDKLRELNIRDLLDQDSLEDIAVQMGLGAKNGSLFESRHRCRDGSTFPVEVSSHHFYFDGKFLRQNIIRDISRRQKMQQELEHAALRFEGLLRLNEKATELPEKQLMEFGLEWVERLTSSKIAFIHFVNEDQETIELVSWSAATRGKYCTASFDEHYPASQAGIWADSLRQHKPVIFNDYALHPDKHGLPEGHSPLLRLISVPVIEGGLVRVILGVGNKESDYDESDVEVASLFGNGMWRIIRRQRVEAQLKQNIESQQVLIRKLEEAQNQLLQSEKMASIGQLAAGVAHELNNPIGFAHSNLTTLQRYIQDIFAITAAYEVVERRVGDAEAFEDVRRLKLEKDFDYIRQDIFMLCEQTRDGLLRIRRVVQNLMDFSHTGEDGWGAVDLHCCIDSTLNILHSELGTRCDVSKEYGEVPEIHCIPGQINQALLNIFLNAIQAIEGRGLITIQTGVEGDQAWVAIRDTGKGISPRDLNRIFEPFFTTKPVGSGTGLGLSLAYSIIQRHRGRIEVQSEVGVGTVMRIFLPLTLPLSSAD